MKFKLLVFTRAFNASKTIRRTIESILNQTFSDFQYCLVDNGSNDRTREIILEYAAKDSRIHPLLYNNNRVRTSLEIIGILSKDFSWDYFIVLDADDEYKKDCFDKLISFSEDNKLDIAACGTDWIDEKTGEIIKCMNVQNNIVLEGRDFAELYPVYRNFTTTVWGIVYSINLLQKNNFEWSKNAVFADSAFVLETFHKAKRAGIYAESLHKYYVSVDSTSNNYNPEWFGACKHLDKISRVYLLSYGEISRQNEDYLYVQLLILIKYILPRIQNADIGFSEKQKLLREIFSDEMTQYMLMHWSEVGIYSDQQEFLCALKEWIDSQAEQEEERLMTEEILSFLNIERTE